MPKRLMANPRVLIIETPHESRGAMSLTRARQRRNFPDSFYIYRGKLHSRADDPPNAIGAPRSCPQRGPPARYRASV